MFDWNDEELDNIVWDEAGESDDHIVPYPEGNEAHRGKKEWNEETDSIKQKEAVAKVDFQGEKLGSSSSLNIDGGISTSSTRIGSWPNLSLSNAAKTGQGFLGTEDSSYMAEVTKCSSAAGETGRLNKDAEYFQDPHGDKEQGDLDDYSWANIGSFDDLDRIFSNDNPVFGNVNLGTPEELWSLSKDVTNSPEKSFPATANSSSLGLGTSRSTPENFQTKTQYEQQGNKSFTLSYGKIDDPAPYSLQNLESSADRNRSFLKEQKNAGAGGKSYTLMPNLAAEKLATFNELPDKAFRQEKLLKFQKKAEDMAEANLLQDFYGRRSCPPSGYPLGQYENQMESFVVNSSPSSVMRQQKQLQGTETLQYQQISTPFIPPTVYGNVRTPYPAMSVLSNIQPGQYKQQPLVSSYDVPLANANVVRMPENTPAKPSTMTPQQKIEKLRRRQQMQALLAIQRQQKQLTLQVPSTDLSITQKHVRESQIQHAEGTEANDLCTAVPSLDSLSPLEQDDSNTVSFATEDFSLEETVLYRLQDIISKLDIRTRLCIRDSLFRLAQSAMHRQYSRTTSNTNKVCNDEHEVATDDSSNHNRMTDAETETNPIDRTVAHLLFHRPLEVSGKHLETPQSRASTKFHGERRSVGLINFSTRRRPDSSSTPHQGSHSQPVNEFANSPCIGTSDNASNYRSAGGVITEAEASQ